LKSIAVVEDDGTRQVVPVDHLNRFLANIGRSDTLLSEEELSSLLEEANRSSSSSNNGGRRSISATDILRFV